MKQLVGKTKMEANISTIYQMQDLTVVLSIPAELLFSINNQRKEIYECIEKYHLMNNNNGEKQNKALWLINNYANILSMAMGDLVLWLL